MFALFFSLLASLQSCFRTRAVLHAELLALRHQLLVLERSSRDRRSRLSNLGPGPLGLPFAALARLAFGPADREARDGHRLAPQEISALLDVEEPYGPRPSSRAQ
jgi:hypothetical protein